MNKYIVSNESITLHLARWALGLVFGVSEEGEKKKVAATGIMAHLAEITRQVSITLGVPR